VQLELVRVAFDLGVRHFHLFWGDPAETAALVHDLGASFFATVGDGAAARAAVDAGAAALVAQGVEAGGHVLSETPLERLLPAVIEAAGDVPVIAAGGITTPDDARAAIGKGAAGVLCGSRFVATHESDAHPAYKTALVRAGADATARSLCFDLGWPDAPHRTLVNDTYRSWREAGFPAMGARPGEGEIVMSGEDGRGLPRYLVMPPLKGMTGDVTEGAMYAGTGVERVDSIETVADVVARFRDALLPGSPAGTRAPETNAAGV
jgi:NAD(P)H-dependent flavin oxidoreductase YrpB (nitropropane dioxygenase family)